MRVPIWLSLLGSLVLVVLLPLFFGSLMTTSLAKLHVSQSVATQLIIGIIVGGFINVPITRIARSEQVPAHPLALLGLDRAFPRLRREREETVIAINVGGAVIPVGLAIYEFAYLTALGRELLVSVGLASLVNIVVCYLLARPVPGLGIAMPGLVPPLVAVAMALVLAPSQAAPVAFIAGVLGPLIGADLLHIKDVTKIAKTGIASIGGAGTFDGIVLSGIVAAYLA